LKADSRYFVRSPDGELQILGVGGWGADRLSLEQALGS